MQRRISKTVYYYYNSNYDNGGILFRFHFILILSKIFNLKSNLLNSTVSVWASQRLQIRQLNRRSHLCLRPEVLVYFQSFHVGNGSRDIRTYSTIAAKGMREKYNLKSGEAGEQCDPSVLKCSYASE